MVDSSIYSRMYQASGLTLNNIGDFEKCNSINNAKYVLLYCDGVPKYALTFCGPDVCTLDYYQNFTSVLNICEDSPLIIFPKEFQEQNYGTYTTGAIIMIVFISLILCLAFFSTCADYFLQEEDKKRKIIKILLCFSLKVNGKILLSASRKRNGKKDSLEVLNAVRVMSLG